MVYVALDYGHGENTYQVTGGKGVVVDDVIYEEHHFNCDVGEQVRCILEAHGVEVLVTQPPYQDDVGLYHRTSTANKENVDMLVSFHANAGVSSASGACTFAWIDVEADNRIADLIVKHLKDQGIGLHGNGRHYSQIGSWTNFHMLREMNPDIPATLVEHGFMTNDHDFKGIFGSNKKDYRRRCAVADAKAILDFFNIKYKDDVKVEPGRDTKVESVHIEKPKKDKVETVSTSDRGKRVESIYKGNEGLDFYSKPSWNDKYKVGTFGHGMGWTLRKKLKVDGYYMYKVNNSNNDVYYITAAEKFVKVVEKSNPKPRSKTLYLPASVDEWNVYKLNVQPVSENARWALTPSAFGGLQYKVLGEPYPNVVTIETSRGRRNIYVAPSTGAVIK